MLGFPVIGHDERATRRRSTPLRISWTTFGLRGSFPRRSRCRGSAAWMAGEDPGRLGRWGGYGRRLQAIRDDRGSFRRSSYAAGRGGSAIRAPWPSRDARATWSRPPFFAA